MTSRSFLSLPASPSVVACKAKPYRRILCPEFVWFGKKLVIQLVVSVLSRRSAKLIESMIFAPGPAARG